MLARLHVHLHPTGHRGGESGARHANANKPSRSPSHLSHLSLTVQIPRHPIAEQGLHPAGSTRRKCPISPARPLLELPCVSLPAAWPVTPLMQRRRLLQPPRRPHSRKANPLDAHPVCHFFALPHAHLCALTPAKVARKASRNRSRRRQGRAAGRWRGSAAQQAAPGVDKEELRNGHAVCQLL